MAVGSELAALLEARRRKNEGDESSNHGNGNNANGDAAASSRGGGDGRRAGGSDVDGPSWIKNKIESTSLVQQAVTSTPATGATSESPHGIQLKSRTATSTTSGTLVHASPSSSSTPAVPSPQHAAATRNPQLQQRMDKANLEAGIPTPDFLVEMRKNLKTKADRGGNVTHGAARLGVQVAESAVVDAAKDAGEKRPTPSKGQRSAGNTTAGTPKMPQNQHESSVSTPAPNTNNHTAASKANNATLSSKAVTATTSSPRHNSDLAARRSRLVAHRHGSTVRTQTTTGGNNNDDRHNNEESVAGQVHATTTNIHDDHSMEVRSSASSQASAPNEGKSANLRRERILAKVRANTTLHKSHKEETRSANGSHCIPSATSGGSETTGKDRMGLDKKIKVTSPHAEEVEMLFADEGFLMNSSGGSEEMQQQQLQQQQRKERMDPNSCKVTDSGKKKPSSSSLARAASAAKKNHSQSLTVHDSPTSLVVAHDSSSSVDGTPRKDKSVNESGLVIIQQQQQQQQRLHMASTPKIRGNGQHRRDQFQEDKDDANQNLHQPQQQTPQRHQQQHQDVIEEETLSQDQWTSPDMEKQRRNSIHSNLPFQPSPQSHTQCLRHPEDDKIHNIHQAYSFNERAPSTISAISGISIPSCFPQDSPFGHLQQPLLVGGSSGFNNGTYTGSNPFVGNTPIKESTSFLSATSNISGNHTNAGLLNAPNFPPKSSPQAVGGLGTSAFSSGVENENRRLREQLGAMQKKLDEKDAIISQLMKRIGDLESSTRVSDADKSSNSGTSNSYSMGQDAYAMSSLWERSRPASDIAYTPYADAEPISMSPSPHPPQSNSTVKQSPTTTHTSSTASLTTATSAKTQSHQRQSSSRSLPGHQSPAGSMGRMKRSPHRRGNAPIGVPNSGDDRRFQC